MLFELILFLVIVTGAGMFKGAKVVKQHEVGLVERLGKYHSKKTSGLSFIVPFIDELIHIDMREQVINVDPQQVITKDNVSVEVDGVVYYRIIEPKKTRYEVENFEIACITLAQTNLRNLIGEQDLDTCLSARDTINAKLQDTLDNVTDAWGVKITRVELQKIDPPSRIKDAMSKQMEAERQKRATVLESEGYKEANINRAEGDKHAAIKRAEGEGQAMRIKAIAQAEAIEKVSTSAVKFFEGNARELKRLEVCEASLKENTKFILPNGSDIINVLGLEDPDATVVPVKK